MMPPGNSRHDGSCRIAARSRSSFTGLASVETWLVRVTRGSNGTPHRRRTPYMGISPAKPMLSRNFESPRVLLSVVGQHLTAAGGEFGAVLLQARQNGEIALIHQGAAKTLDVPRAGLLLLRRTT